MKLFNLSDILSSDIFNNKKKFSILIMFFMLVVFSCGVLTDLRYSDEIYHFWFAKDWYSGNQRPVYNDLVDTVPEYGYYRYYVMAPLWHYLLKSTFYLSGSSKNVAQIHMVFWYALLIFGTYLLARTLYDEQLGLYSAFIIATMPFVVSFSILFFIDVPIAAVTPYLIYFVIKRKYLLSGVIMGLMFLLKRNSYLLFPPACLLLLFNFQSKQPVNLLKRFLQVTLFSILVLAATLPDFKYRLDKFNGLLIPNDGGQILKVPAYRIKQCYLSFQRVIPTKAAQKASETTPRLTHYFTCPLLSIPSFVKYFGLLFPCLLIWRIISIFRYKDFNLKEIAVLIPIIFYIPFYFFAFIGGWEIRYLSPIIPLMCIFIIKGIRHLKPWARTIIVLVGCIMFISTVTYTYMVRQVTSSEREIISLIKELPSERILTPEELFISYYTDKPTVWKNSFRGTTRYRLSEFFWNDDSRKRQELLGDFKIKYILIPHRRNYDDTEIRHFGGYPKSFVEKIEYLPFVEEIYKNDYASLWRVSF